MKIQNVRTHSARRSAGKKSTSPAANGGNSHSGETVLVDMVSFESGKVVESAEWPLDLWEKVNARALSLGISLDEHISNALTNSRGRVSKVEIKPTSSLLGRLIHVASILEQDPGRFACLVLERYMNEIFERGKLVELEAEDATYGTKKEKKRVMARAEAFDRQRRAFREGRAAL